MTDFRKLSRAFLAVLCLFPQVPAAAVDDVQPIRIICDDVRLAALCDELAQALAETQIRRTVAVIDSAETPGAAHICLRFATTRFTDSVLSGHLTWRDPAGRTGAGPMVDLTVMDATISAPMLRDYARQLLRRTELPL